MLYIDTHAHIERGKERDRKGVLLFYSAYILIYLGIVQCIIDKFMLIL